MYPIIIAVFLSLSLFGSEAAADHKTQTVDALPMTFKEGVHRYFVRTAEDSTGQDIKVPVIVVQGPKAGKSMLITAAVHGDELNGIRVIHKLLSEVKPRDLKGRIIMVPGVNQPGLIANNRHFVASGGGGFMVDLNRNFPGEVSKGSAAKRYLGRFWDGVVKDRTDIGIDLHTQTRGTAYPFFLFADTRNPRVRAIANALMPDMLKNDKGEHGTLETTLMSEGIPAVTLEVGEPKRFQADLVDKSVKGILNVMRLEGLLKGKVVKPAKAPITGDRFTNIEARRGGVAVIDVQLMDKVKKGDLVARVFNPFGQEIDRYLAPHDGYVLSLATDPMREPGAMLVRILE